MNRGVKACIEPFRLFINKLANLFDPTKAVNLYNAKGCTSKRFSRLSIVTKSYSGVEAATGAVACKIEEAKSLYILRLID